MVKRIAITGATGFLGGRAAKILTDRGYEVTALGRNERAGAELVRAGIRFERLDLSDREGLARVFRDQDAVVHSAALASPWGPLEEFLSSNVEGTRNVIAGMLGSKVQRWVHISTPSIYIDGTSREGIRESDPIPAKQINHYAATKLEAERVVASEPSPPVVILRPQGIFGPGDPTLVPRLVRLGKKGKLPLVGDGSNKFDLTYVDNVVDAIERALLSGPETFGRAYNISNGEPVEVFATLSRLLADLGYPAKALRLPRGLATAAATALESVYKLVSPRKEPPLTRYSIVVLANSRTLDITAARTELGYVPRVTVEEGIRRTVEAYRRDER